MGRGVDFRLHMKSPMALEDVQLGEQELAVVGVDSGETCRHTVFRQLKGYHVEDGLKQNNPSGVKWKGWAGGFSMNPNLL